MIQIRPSAERGRFDHGWLDTRHTFSFGEYFDPQQRGFRDLRVINEDVIAPEGGFGMHPHRDMEIVTYIVSGELRHRDSLGNSAVMWAGEMQAMSAGTGILHSEFNPSPEMPVHLLQIWIKPRRTGLAPRYEQRSISVRARAGAPVLVASPDGRDGSLTIHQNALIHGAELRAGGGFTHALGEERHAWIQVVRGPLVVNGTVLNSGDGAAFSGERELRVAAEKGAELLLFDLA